MTLHENSTLQGGKYKIVRFISSGGFGCTYEAIDTLMDTRVAIKEFFVKDFCNRDASTSRVTLATQSKGNLVEKLRKKFMDEARALFNMRHDNIVRVHNIFEENDTAYYVMEYVDGSSLSDVLKLRGKLPEQEALGYIRQVADALKYVHSKNRLHLDVKPGNILIDKTGKAVLIDFGASKHYDEGTGESTTTMQGLNTPGYAPYEQTVAGITEFSPASDIYALGATLYKTLTGVTPPNAGLRVSGRETLAPLPATISDATRRTVDAAMQLGEKNRPQSIDAFLGLLGESKPVAPQKPKETPEEMESDTVIAGKQKPQPRPQQFGRQQQYYQNQYQPKPGAKNPLKWIIIGGVAVVSLLVLVLVAAIAFGSDSGATTNSDGSLTFEVKGVEFNMAQVKGGTFTMGGTAEQGDLVEDDEKATHEVTLSDYYIGKTEVTQALWMAVMGDNPSYFEGDNLPVDSVSWGSCQEFIERLNSLTGKKFRLPTEAEWEFAARGGKSGVGYKYSGSDNIADVAWFGETDEGNYGNGDDRIHPVGSKHPNELGIYDMSGNVFEWCSDWHDEYITTPETNPTGPSSGEHRILRGGSFEFEATCCRVSNRDYLEPTGRMASVGFRLALASE